MYPVLPELTLACAPCAANPSRTSVMSNQCFTVSASVHGVVGELGNENSCETHASVPSGIVTAMITPLKRTVNCITMPAVR